MDDHLRFRGRLGIIGAGKVGGTLARLWSAKGYAITAVYSRRPDSARGLAAAVGAQAAGSAQDVLVICDLTLLCVPDDSITTIARSLAVGDLSGKGVVHTSGAHTLHALDALAAGGAMIGSFHPAYPFASNEPAPDGLKDVTFALETSHERLKHWLASLVQTLDGRTIALQPQQKTLYHAALVIASNYSVTLFAAAERLLASVGAEPAAAQSAIHSLMAATLDNLRTHGTPDALTGPLVREDTGTIMAHLEALENTDPQTAATYRALTRLTYPLLAQRGISTDRIEFLLRQHTTETDHHDNTTDHP